MKNIFNKILGASHVSATKDFSRDAMTTADLVAHLTSGSGQKISEKDANRVLVEMDFDDVERRIFGVQDLSVVPADVASNKAIVPSGYPFMDRVKSLVEHRLGLKGIHALR